MTIWVFYSGSYIQIPISSLGSTSENGQEGQEQEEGKGCGEDHHEDGEEGESETEENARENGRGEYPKTMPVGVMLKYPLIDIVDTLANPI